MDTPQVQQASQEKQLQEAQMNAVVNTLTEQRNNAMNALASAASARAALEHRNSVLLTNCNLLQQQLTDKDATITGLNASIASLNENVAHNAAEKEAIAANYKDLEDRFAALTAEHEATLKDYQTLLESESTEKSESVPAEEQQQSAVAQEAGQTSEASATN